MTKNHQTQAIRKNLVSKIICDHVQILETQLKYMKTQSVLHNLAKLKKSKKTSMQLNFWTCS